MSILLKEDVKLFSFIGLFNSGKSSIINSIVQKDVLACHRKRNTTIRGQYIDVNFQNQCIRLMDNPGFTLIKKDRKNCYIQSEDYYSSKDLYYLHVVDCRIFYRFYKNSSIISSIYDNKFYINNVHLIKKVQEHTCKKDQFSILINKIDLIPYSSIPTILDFVSKNMNFYSNFFLTSTKKKNGVRNVASYIIQTKNYFVPDYSNTPLQYTFSLEKKCNKVILIKEKIRQILLENLHNEIPYVTVVKEIKCYFGKNCSIVHVYIIVKRKSQFKILFKSKEILERSASFVLSKSLKNDFKVIFFIKKSKK